MSQPRPTQQQGLGNMQLWQQHLMYKQLEIQRQRQLQQQNLGGRQHNTLGHVSDVDRHACIMQSPPDLSGMPINRPSDHSWSSEPMRGESKVPNSSLVFHAGNVNWAQRAGPQICGDDVVFSHGQGQTAHPQEFVQHHGGQQSLYGTPLSGTKYFSNQYPQLQGLSHDYSDLMMNRSGGNSAENVSIQPTTLSYLKNDQSVQDEHGCVQDDILVAKQGIQGRSSFGSVQVQRTNGGVMLGNFQQTNHLAHSVQAQEFQGGQERDNWSWKLHESKMLQVGPSPGMADLDTKEKLYTVTDVHCDGSFGDSTITNTGSNQHINHMHNYDRTNAFSSIQSGSWSALMMDALEASSSDTGPQEEWSGLNFVKAESSHQNQFAPLNNNGKQQLHWDEKNLQSASSLTSSSHPSVNNADVSPNHHSLASCQQSTKFAYEENESLSAEVSHESSQHSFKDAKNIQFNECHQRNQFVPGSPREQTSFDNVSDGLWAQQVHGQPVSSRHSVDMEFNTQNMQMVRDKQQRILLGNTVEVSTSSILDSVNLEGHELKHGGNQVVIPFPISVGGQEPVKSQIDSTKMWDKDSNRGNFLPTDSSSLNFNQEMKQELFYQHLQDSGKHVATHSFLNSEGAENVAWYQNQQFRQSSLNSNVKIEAGEELCQNQESCSPGDVPDEGYMSSHSQLMPHTDSGSGPKENSCTTGNNSGLLVSSSQKSSGQNYSQGPNHSVLRGLNNHEQGDIVRSGNVSLVTHPRFNDVTKEQLTDTQRNPQVGGDSSCALPRHYPASWSYDALNTHVSQNNWVGPASHNMLELLHKVAQPSQWQLVSDNDLASQASSTTSVPSLPLANQVPPDKFNNGSNIYGQMAKTSSSGIEANPWAFTTSNRPCARGGSAMQQQQQQHPQQENVSNVTISSPMDPSPNPSVEGQVNIDAIVQHSSRLRQKGYSDGNMHAQPSQRSSHSAATPASHFPSSRLDPSRGTCAPASSQIHSFSSGPSQPVYSSSLPRASGQKLSVLEARSAVQPSSTSDMPREGGFSSILHKVCSGLSAEQHQSILQAKKIISRLPQSMGALSNNSMGRKLWAQKLDNQRRQIGGSVSSAFQQELNGRTSACDSSLDFHKERFCLNANVQKRNYSELQQVQVMQGLNSDPTRRFGKRLKGEDVGADAPQMELAAGQRLIYEQSVLCGELDADSQHSSFPSDVKMVSFPRENEDESMNTNSQFVSLEKSSEDLHTSRRINMQNNTHYLNQTSTVTSINECPQINSQTALSFEQNISYINGQLVATCDGPSNIQDRAKATAQHYPFAKLCKNMDDANENFFAHSMPANAIDTNVVLITKKRKTATSKLLPWHKELAQDSQRLLSVSTSQLNWAKAANTLIEKVEDDSELIVCKSLAQPRRRLILTTQLMQQLIPSVPATFLRADAITSYESVTFFVAKLSLGEACSLAFCSGSDSLVHCNSENITPEMLESSEGRVHFLSRGIDGFVGRRKKVESDLLRLEMEVSMLDVMVECHALDRFSIVNRLAKFHGPPQTRATRSSCAAETLSSTIFTQRHVTPHTMTAHPPKDLLCLSL